MKDLSSRTRLLTTFAGRLPDRVPVAPFVYTSWLENAPSDCVAKLIRETDLLVGLPLALDLHWIVGETGLHNWRRRIEGTTVIDEVELPGRSLHRLATFAESRREDRELNLSGPLDLTTDALLGRTVRVVERLCPTIDALDDLLSLSYGIPAVDLANYRNWERRLGEDALLVPTCYDAFYLLKSLLPPDQLVRLASSTHIYSVLHALNERVLEVVRAAAEGGVSAFCIVGPEYIFSLLHAADRYADLIAPYDAEVHRHIRGFGACSLVHMHGPVTALLADIAATCPDALDPLEGPPGGDVDLAVAKRMIGDRICLVGNLHDFKILHDLAPAQLGKVVDRCLEAAAAGGRYVLAGSHTGIYDRKAVDNWTVIARTAREHGSYSA